MKKQLKNNETLIEELKNTINQNKLKISSTNSSVNLTENISSNENVQTPSNHDDNNIPSTNDVPPPLPTNTISSTNDAPPPPPPPSGPPLPPG